MYSLRSTDRVSQSRDTASLLPNPCLDSGVPPTSGPLTRRIHPFLGTKHPTTKPDMSEQIAAGRMQAEAASKSVPLFPISSQGLTCYP